MKKTIYIYINSDSNEPEVFMTKEAALAEMEHDLEYHQERWGYDVKELAEAELELERQVEAGREWCGTYLGELGVDLYTREIEI